MRTDQPIDAKGYFWLPENPTEQLAGTLHIGIDGGSRLELFGHFGSFNAMASRRLTSKIGSIPPNLNLILGHIEPNRKVTLYQCFDDGAVNFGGYNFSTIQVGWAFLDHHFGRAEDISFNKLQISLDGLHHWLGISGISVATDLDKWFSNISFEPPETIKYPLNDNLVISFEFQFKVPISYSIAFEATVKCIPVVVLSWREPIPWDALWKSWIETRNLFRFVMDAHIPVNSVSATPYFIRYGCECDRDEAPMIRIFGRDENIENQVKIDSWFGMLFRYIDVKDKFSDIVEEWYGLNDRYVAPLKLYFRAIEVASDDLETPFLDLIRAMETFDAIEHASSDAVAKLNDGHSKDATLRQRVHRVVNALGDVFGDIKTKKRLIQRIIEYRNNLTHRGEFKTVNGAVHDENLILNLKMRIIVALTILRLIGFDEMDIADVIHRKHMWSQWIEIPLPK